MARSYAFHSATGASDFLGLRTGRKGQTEIVYDDGVVGEAKGDGVAIVPIGGKIGRDRPRQGDRHGRSPICVVSGLRSPYPVQMTRTDEKVRYSPESKGSGYTRETAAEGVENVLKLLEGRWKLIILFHLFGGNVMRFSDLERAIPAVSQKMLIQQLRQMEGDGIVRRIVHHQVPPKVEYCLTEWGQALCPALDALLSWAALREEMAAPVTRSDL